MDIEGTRKWIIGMALGTPLLILLLILVPIFTTVSLTTQYDTMLLRLLNASQHVVMGETLDMNNNPLMNVGGSGSATITTGATSTTIAHGVSSVPALVMVTPQDQEGAVYFVDNVGGTNFRVVLPAAQADDTIFYWWVIK